jgi:hypothetical protein
MLSCQQSAKNTTVEDKVVIQRLTLEAPEADRLVALPLACIDSEYPNKLNQVIGNKMDLQSPEILHPAFYGCFDWHSSVHGHWSLVRLIKSFPEMESYDKIINGLLRHISAENIASELEYFDNELSQGFERMYGWAWLLKLAEELHNWEDPAAKEIEINLKPLSDLIANRVKIFLPKLNYPIRVGTHTNTAFAMTMVYDYACAVADTELKEIVVKRAREYFLNDVNCPLSWEPSGYDFVSPCLEEADLMRRILPKKEFKKWLVDFLPRILDPEFTLKPGIVSDREDGHLVHLDGLNYSRAWCLYGIAETLPEYQHLIKIANEHIEYSLPNMTDGNYEGGHWLASFALLAMSN